MRKHNILILNSNEDIMGPWFKRLRPLAKLHHHLTFVLHHVWYGAWKSQLDQYDAIIIFENYWAKSLIKFIRTKNKQCRVILYYINPVDDIRCRSSPVFLRHLACELYSFDRRDCAALKMKFNPWCLPAIYPLKSVPRTCDAFFIGSDKGRIATLIDLKGQLEARGYKTHFVIVRDPRKKYGAVEQSHLTENRVSYDAVVEMIQQSHCLVEILQPGQSGMTERCMEALVYRKKLITNNQDVFSYDFYRKENIFVLGKDPIETIGSFLTSPMFHVDESVTRRFTYDAWIQRFFESTIPT